MKFVKGEKRESVIHEIDGVFYHSKWNGGTAKAGSVAGIKNKDGYFEIRLNDRRVLRHVLVWEKYNGLVPEGLVIDHINGIPGDDRIENLQAVTRSENHSLGVHSLYASNTSGANGVCWNTRAGKWKATCKVNRVGYHVGHYDTVEEAAKAIDKYKIDRGFPISRRNHR